MGPPVLLPPPIFTASLPFHTFCPEALCHRVKTAFLHRETLPTESLILTRSTSIFSESRIGFTFEAGSLSH